MGDIWNSTLPRRTPLQRSPWPRPALSVVVPGGAPVVPGGAPVVPLRRPAGRTHPADFTPKVRGLIHARAEGFCEACGAPLPDSKGQCQHRVARRMGGSRNPLLGSAANGADLCGTPTSGCHGLCEARDERMHAMGFWLYSWEDPLLVPVLLHSPGGSGVRVWLTADGGYSTEPPVRGGAA